MKKWNALKWPFLAAVLLLSACRGTGYSATDKSVASDQQRQTEQDGEKLQQCQQELAVLGSLKTRNFEANKQAFDQLMGSAAQYASLRNKVNGTTQGTVDALYHYKVSLLCAEISQAVLFQLARLEGPGQ